MTAELEPFITCLITIHGIGFQHAPQDGQPGFADGLQASLKTYLPDLLSGDPVSEFGRPAGEGAVYVHSAWPPGSGNETNGLRRLGSWSADDPGHRHLDITGVPLVEDGRSIAHVALVYAGLELQEPYFGSTSEVLVRAALSHGRYASLPRLAMMTARDAVALIGDHIHGNTKPTPSLQARPSFTSSSSATVSEGLGSILEAIGHDVVAYITWNELRERVRSFVHEAILRVSLRPDVRRVIINAHSQGTVVAFDVLQGMAPLVFARLAGFVSAGSPLRKYVDFFYWGTNAGPIASLPWVNFWDARDPVADPLAPPPSWRPGTAVPTPSGKSELYRSIDPDTGSMRPVAMSDHLVQNAQNGAGGSLPAHDYWDNRDQFVAPLAAMLRDATR